MPNRSLTAIAQMCSACNGKRFPDGCPLWKRTRSRYAMASWPVQQANAPFSERLQKRIEQDRARPSLKCLLLAQNRALTMARFADGLLKCRGFLFHKPPMADDQ